MQWLKNLFDAADFPARWNCGRWTAPHGWVHIISDVLVFGAYVAIPCVLWYFIRKRKDVPFTTVFVLFGAFILSCGTVHLIEAVIFWYPVYRVSALVKAVTAIVSWATVLALIPIVPQALALPGLAQVNRDLELEVDERRRSQETLNVRTKQLEDTNCDLESFTRVVTGRESRVIELKQEVDALLKRLGEPPRYADSDDTDGAMESV